MTATAVTPGSRIVELGRPPDWMAQGTCASYPDPDLWFAAPSSPEGRLAKRLCASCPVVLTCRQYARASNEGAPEESGIWGAGDFNADQNYCANGHWETENSRNAHDKCKPCKALEARKRRAA